ncbi:GmrSD restriction endonuclease domain-containing protein [Thiocapsa marina]|uniref:GmrSD restriction endonucleases N-terminal domain-containing protein n=1 Tax=Thiocapsa marina 5811 TaxID=768671 RepID=F9UI82_9GAMM|nr:DUF262 domain-containing protein [Thiocapsa marina]EGV16087.1 protein of unknown function DUF262 [Thiocapsa marina 5811]
MKTSATNRRLRVLLTDIREEKLIPRPEFQRRLVWTNRHKESFIQTVLLGLPFPEIYIASGEVDTTTGEGKEMLVDGQQRITTLSQFFTGSEDLKLKEIAPYVDLPVDAKKSFLEYEVVIRDLGSKNIEEIKDVFRRINSTKYSLNAMEIHNARFDGALKQFVDELSRSAFFDNNRVFGTTEIRRMGDVTFCLTVVITTLAGYFNRDSLFEEFLEKYNDEFEHSVDLKEELQSVFDLIEHARLGPNSRAWRKADLLTLIVELYHFTVRRSHAISPEQLKACLESFYQDVGKAAEGDTEDADAASYHKATLQATADKSSRVRRGEALQAQFNKLLAID